mgnify:CR=1 FL=1
MRRLYLQIYLTVAASLVVFGALVSVLWMLVAERADNRDLLDGVGAIALEMIAGNLDGADAAIIAAFGDPGLAAARELFDLPEDRRRWRIRDQPRCPSRDARGRGPGAHRDLPARPHR